jgi:hypothetical protein
MCLWETWPAERYLVSLLVSPFKIASVRPGFEESMNLIRGRRALVGLCGFKST